MGADGSKTGQGGIRPIPRATLSLLSSCPLFRLAGFSLSPSLPPDPFFSLFPIGHFCPISYLSSISLSPSPTYTSLLVPFLHTSMNNHHSSSPLLSSWAYYCQGKSMEELRQSLLYTTVELEQTRAAVQEELRKRDDQISHLKDLLQKAIRERDEAQGKCQRLLLEKLLQQTQQQQHQQTQQNQQTAPLSGISSIEDEPRRGIDSNNGFSSSDCEESIVSSPVIDPIQQTQQLPPRPSLPHPSVELLPEKPLPEKGKLLQAVMKAGPLLQTLLLAGPLPQWRHPPPPLESFEIPPVTIPSPPPQPPLHTQLQHQDSSNVNCGIVNRKRVLCDGSASPPETKFQRVALR